MEEEKVSVIIPTYNRPKLLARAIESVFSQTYKNFEIIVIDGNEGIETKNEISIFLNDPRIVYYHIPDKHDGTEKERGNIARARNKGIGVSSGKYIACLDDDDFWCNNLKLEKQVNFLNSHEDCVLCGGGVLGIIKENPQIPYVSGTFFPEKDENIRNMFFAPTGMVHSTVMYTKEAWKKVGGYEEVNPLGEDFDLYLKLGTVGRIYNFQEYFCCFILGEQKKDHIKRLARKCLLNHMSLIFKYRHKYPRAFVFLVVDFLYLCYTFFPLFFKNIFGKVSIFLKKFIRSSVGIHDNTSVLKSAQFREVASHLQLKKELEFANIKIEIS